MAKDSAADARISFGMYTGLTVGEVAKLPDGDKYLLSLANNRSIGKPLREAIQKFYLLTEMTSKR
jgi:hypothetical protein